MQFTQPEQEALRLRDLQNLGLLDSGKEAAYDDLVRLAADVCDVPIAAVSLVDSDRQWFKAQCGLAAAQTPREQSFCSHAILRPDELMVVPDATQDPRFAQNPLVLGEPHIRFYAGAPLVSARGQALGALCVIDNKPRTLSDAQQRALLALARQVGALIELRRKRQQLEQQENFLLTVIEALHEGVLIRDSSRRLLLANQSASEMLGMPLQDDVGKMPRTDPNSWRQLDGRPLRPEELPAERSLRSGETLHSVYTRLRRPDGSERVLEHSTRPLRRERRIDGVVVSLRDVTARLDAAQRLRESEARLQVISDNLPALIACVDAQRTLRFCNRMARDWLQRPTEQVLGLPLQALLPAADYAEHLPHIDAVLAGERREFGLWSTLRDGPHFIQFAYVPDRDDQGMQQGFFVLASDLTETKALQIRLSHEACHDALTGLPNRQHFDEQLMQALQRGRRHQKPLALGVLDIDHFKRINDSHGHAVGDLVLQEFARRLRGALRQTDQVARLAGDEFTLLLEDLQQSQDLEPLATKLLDAIRQPVELPGLQLRIRCSLGLALAEPGEPADSLRQRADLAMYQAKLAGRDGFALAAPPLRP